MGSRTNANHKNQASTDYVDTLYSIPPATSLIARFMGPTWVLSGADRTQVGPMLTPWTVLSGKLYTTRIILPSTGTLQYGMARVLKEKQYYAYVVITNLIDDLVRQKYEVSISILCQIIRQLKWGITPNQSIFGIRYIWKTLCIWIHISLILVLTKCMDFIETQSYSCYSYIFDVPHLISRSKLECMSICLDMPGCQGVNFNATALPLENNCRFTQKNADCVLVTCDWSH